MATVEVEFTPLPAHVRTARLVATAVARRSGVDEELLDEVRLAVGEACSRAVEAHRRHCPTEPVRIEMTDLGERFEVIVRDAVPSGPATAVNGAAANGTAHHGAADHGAADHGADSTSVVPSATAGSGPVPAGAAGQDAVSAGVPGGSDGFAGQDGSAVPSSTTVPSSTAVPSDVFISGFGLAVISGLADDVRVSATASGVSVRMTWPAALSTRA